MGKIHYGLHETIISDQGRKFQCEIGQELCKLGQVKKLRTSPYHPQTNVQCEKFISKLINMIGTLNDKSKSQQKKYVSTLIHAYNCTRINATEFSLYFLMYGRKPRLPINLYFSTQTADLCASTSTRFAQQLRDRLQYNISNSSTGKCAGNKIQQGKI